MDAMEFTPVTDYYRQKHYDFFAGYDYPFYAITFEVDMTEVRAFAKRHDYSLYFNLCYLFTRAANRVDGLLYRMQDQMVRYKMLHPRLIVDGDQGRYAFLRVLYDPDIHRFNQAAQQALQDHSREDLSSEAFHTNFIFFTSLPKVPFTGLTHAPANSRTSGEPMVSFGRFRELNGRLLVPIGVQVNHLYVDGHMLGQLYEELQACFAMEGQG